MVLDSHAARLVEVEIMDFEPAWLDSLFAMPTPQLNAITLSARIEPEELDEWNDEEQCRFSSTALHEGVPSLQSLSISGFIIHLDSPLLCNLTSLDLWVEHAPYTVGLDRHLPSEFLRALQGMPRLSSLHINYALEPDWPLDHPIAVTLPVLSDLQFRVESIPDLKILQYMAIPSIEHITLGCDEIAECEDLAITTPHIHALLPPYDPSLGQIILMVRASHHQGQNESRITIKINAQPTDKPSVDLVFTFMGMHCFTADLEDPLDAFRPLLGPISTLDFDGYAEVQNGTDPSFLIPFFHALAEVRELRISDLNDIGFALQPHDAHETQSEGRIPMTYPLPSLKRILLSQERDPADMKQSVIRIRDILLERKTRGAAIDVLEVVPTYKWRTVREAKITPQDLEPLIDVIQVVFLDQTRGDQYRRQFLSLI
ncbi:hypothetical protein EYR36_007785 [Pleurotus pulmonarius]|nr:hypothetical protein EYR36_007785 [Pleurotus pulmonarius]